MAEAVTLLDPRQLKQNPDNPRLIFREEELQTLADSIAKQGILVPLTVYQDGEDYRILDGERRWRCALRLGLTSIPLIAQPKPDRMQNLMMMFAIHNARKDWDPLPTALKLEELEAEFTRRHKSSPSETELAGLASIPRGEVRRLKKLLKLPLSYRKELLDELEKPKSAQILSVDHVIEASAGTEALLKREIINESEVETVRRAIIDKFKTKIIDNTVAPRKLGNLARAVERNEVSMAAARESILRLINDPGYTIDFAYTSTVERADFEHGIEQLLMRLSQKLEELEKKQYTPSEKLLELIHKVAKELRKYG